MGSADGRLSSRSRPEWVRTLNALGDPHWVSLGERELLDEAVRRTGLADFGGDTFREPLGIFLSSLESEAKLNLIGRILARSDVINLLENRLRIAEACKCNPEIAGVTLRAPIFITGLPRTGTSILHELLARDPGSRVPLGWEVRHPCPPPDAATYEVDPRIDEAAAEIEFWNLVAPEYRTIHEVGARIPVECINLTAHEFASELLSGCHQVPTYAAWLAQADMRAAYAYHRKMLQLLGWRSPGERWVLKAPSHMVCLDALLAAYPDARIIQTHRDPLRVMGSVASTLYATAWIRSDEVDATRIRSWFDAEACARLLDNAARLRDGGAIDDARIVDVRYQDLVADPIATVASIYDHFAIDLSQEAESRMRAHLATKPKDKHGVHAYAFADTDLDLEAERARFATYQERFGVASEV